MFVSIGLCLLLFSFSFLHNLLEFSLAFNFIKCYYWIQVVYFFHQNMLFSTHMCFWLKV